MVFIVLLSQTVEIDSMLAHQHYHSFPEIRQVSGPRSTTAYEQTLIEWLKHPCVELLFYGPPCVRIVSICVASHMAHLQPSLDTFHMTMW